MRESDYYGSSLNFTPHPRNDLADGHLIAAGAFLEA